MIGRTPPLASAFHSVVRAWLGGPMLGRRLHREVSFSSRRRSAAATAAATADDADDDADDDASDD